MEYFVADLIEYAISVVPLSFAMLAVPPLSSFDPFPLEKLSEADVRFFYFIYSLVPPALLRRTYVQSLVLDSTNSTSLTPYVTHMFVHASYFHLMTNVRGFLMLGFPVFQQFGGLASNLIFLSGGIAGALNVDWQKLKLNDEVVAQAAQDTSIVGRTAKALNKVVESAVKSIDESRGRLYMGASGGVCALLGANLVLLAKDTVVSFQDLMVYLKKEDKSIRNSSLALFRMARLCWNTMQVSSILSTMQVEVSSLNSQLNKPLTVWSLFDFSNSVNHAAHVQGFLFGAGAACALLLVQNANYVKISGSGSYPGSGRRLGRGGGADDDIDGRR